MDSTQAEAAVLGACLISQKAADHATSRLTPADFARGAHQLVFGTVATLRKGGRDADVLTVSEMLSRQDRLDEAGGPAALYDLTVNVPSPTSIATYVGLVKDHAERRKLAALARELGTAALDGSRPLHGLLGDARSRLEDVRPAGRRLSLFTDDQLDQLPAVEWLVSSYVQHRGFNIVYGPWKQGKSFVVLDLVLTLLSGATNWHRLNVRPIRSAVYVAAEGAHGMASRRKAWRQKRGTSPKGFHLVGSPLSLLDQSDVGELDSVVADTGAELLVIDTWARCIGGDENSNHDAGEAVRALDRIRDRHGCSILVVHHSGHMDGTRGRGASALPAAADSQIKVTKDGDHLLVVSDFAKEAARTAQGLSLRLESCGPSAVPVIHERKRGEESDGEILDRLRNVLRGRPESVVELDKLAGGRNDLVEKLLEAEAYCIDPMELPAKYRIANL